MTNATTTETKKRIFRVETTDGVLSSHTKIGAAYVSLAKHEEYAAKGIVGLTPETLLRVTRWNGKSWVAISEVR